MLVTHCARHTHGFGERFQGVLWLATLRAGAEFGNHLKALGNGVEMILPREFVEFAGQTWHRLRGAATFADKPAAQYGQLFGIVMADVQVFPQSADH